MDDAIYICEINGIYCNMDTLLYTYVLLKNKDNILQLCNSRLDQNNNGELYVLVDKELFDVSRQIFSMISEYIIVHYDKRKLPYADIVCNIDKNITNIIIKGVADVINIEVESYICYTNIHTCCTNMQQSTDFRTPSSADEFYNEMVQFFDT